MTAAPTLAVRMKIPRRDQACHLEESVCAGVLGGGGGTCLEVQPSGV
eukprot:CAMPEP_0114267726 /NCGR_PEP_ID=MMETSP0058-20121206/25498_1 /TAXON_ID=36894 /ORGANISM="Pyramimonas parkeae, CCMP726" /LENGTH=46 /DNA_ID= /DNA_START= /DNA_END= /DNA_ORIENTATION=